MQSIIEGRTILPIGPLSDSKVWQVLVKRWILWTLLSKALRYVESGRENRPHKLDSLIILEAWIVRALCQRNDTTSGHASVASWPPKKTLLEILTEEDDDEEKNEDLSLRITQRIIEWYRQFSACNGWWSFVFSHGNPFLLFFSSLLCISSRLPLRSALEKLTRHK
jgi:hypothetical protein